MSDIVSEVVKSGKTVWFEVKMKHKAATVEVWVRSHPTIEEFFSSISGGQVDTIDAYGRYWSSLSPESPTKVHKLAKDLDLQDRIYAVDNPGGAFDEDRNGAPRVNISFLRMVGIGTPDGARFVINTPIHLPGMRTLESKLANAVRAFADDFIVPASVTLRLVGSEDK